MDLQPPLPGWVEFFVVLDEQYNRQPHPRLKATAKDAIVVTVDANAAAEEGRLLEMARQQLVEGLGEKYRHTYQNIYTTGEFASISHLFSGRAIPLISALWQEEPSWS